MVDFLADCLPVDLQLEIETREAGMTQIDVAHIREQGQDMIIAPLDGSFDQKTQQQQQAPSRRFKWQQEVRGCKARLPWCGPQAEAWKFIAPQPWHPFFRGIDIRWVMGNLNRSLTW